MSSQDSKSPAVRRASTSTSSDDRSDTGPITIEIRGHRLSIRSDRDPEFVHRLADYVDDTLEELHEAAPAAPFEKLLMLASMTVTEELFEVRSELRQTHRQLEESTESMFELLEDIEDVDTD